MSNNRNSWLDRFVVGTSNEKVHFRDKHKQKKMFKELKTLFHFLAQLDFRHKMAQLAHFAAKACTQTFHLPFLGLHQSSISPDKGEEWQERTGFGY